MTGQIASEKQTMKSSDEYYKKILEVASDGFLLLDCQGNFLEANTSYCLMTGYTLSELRKINISDIDIDHDTAGIKKHIKKVMTCGSDRFESRYRQKNGACIDVELSIGFLNVENGQIVGFCRDISSRKKMERELRRNEASLKLAQHLAHTGNWELNIVTNTLTWSEETYRIFEEDPSDFGANYESFLALIHPDDREKVNQAYHLSLKNKTPYNVEHRLLTKDGRIKYIHEFCESEFAPDGTPILSRGIAQDISERKQTEEALLEIEARLRTISDNLPSGMVYEIDSGIKCEIRRFLYVSAGIEKLHGITPEQAKKNAALVYDQIHEEDRPVLANLEAAAREKMQIFRCQARIKHPSGEIRWSQFSSSPHLRKDNHIVWHGIETDITQLKMAEAENLALENRLNQIQKLDSLAILAGGIAHDFNNLFAGIYGNLDLANSISQDEKVSFHLTCALQTIERARGLTQQLLTFSGSGVPNKRTGLIDRCIIDTTRFALTGTNIICKFDFQNDLWPCDFDTNQISQVINNLVINARQAMPEGGNLEISAVNVPLEDKNRSPFFAGRYIKIVVKDTGIGIPKEAIPNLFDPFFTTKFGGHGLGLPTCFSIIHRHEGYIEAASELGKGSTFTVYLPASDKPISNVTTTPETRKHKGNGTILVMDDDEILRETFSTMLQSLGYSVVCKENGTEAVAYFAAELKAGRQITGMLFDLTIPGGPGGKETIKEIRKLCQNTPVFVASGYASDPIMTEPQKYGFTASICKPFKRADLEKMLQTYIVNKL